MDLSVAAGYLGLFRGGGDPHPLTVQKSGDLHLGCMKPCK